MMIKHFVPFIVIFILSIVAQAQTVDVILNPGGTVVLSIAPPLPLGYTYDVAPTTIATSDARWTNFLALQNINATAKSLLATGVAMTFTTTTGATGNYCATTLDVQSLLNTWTDRVSIGASAIFAVPICAGSATTKSMGQLAFKDLLAAVKSYNTAVLAAQATATANNTAPVWPTNAYSSTH